MFALFTTAACPSTPWPQLPESGSCTHYPALEHRILLRNQQRGATIAVSADTRPFLNNSIPVNHLSRILKLCIININKLDKNYKN
jgi:hypothetical protein